MGLAMGNRCHKRLGCVCLGISGRSDTGRGFGLPVVAARPGPHQQEQGASRGQVLLSVLMEFWLTDGDCPLPGADGGNSGPNTPRLPWDGFYDANDGWGGLLSMPSSSLRQEPPALILAKCICCIMYERQTSEPPLLACLNLLSIKQCGLPMGLPVYKSSALLSTQFSRYLYSCRQQQC